MLLLRVFQLQLRGWRCCINISLLIKVRIFSLLKLTDHLVMFYSTPFVYYLEHLSSHASVVRVISLTWYDDVGSTIMILPFIYRNRQLYKKITKYCTCSYPMDSNWNKRKSHMMQGIWWLLVCKCQVIIHVSCDILPDDMGRFSLKILNSSHSWRTSSQNCYSTSQMPSIQLSTSVSGMSECELKGIFTTANTSLTTDSFWVRDCFNCFCRSELL